MVADGIYLAAIFFDPDDFFPDEDFFDPRAERREATLVPVDHRAREPRTSMCAKGPCDPVE